MSDFQSHTDINWTGNVGVVQYGGGPQRQIAMFYNKPVHNAVKSRESGRPIFETRVYVRVAPPGERLNIVDRPATRQDQQIWPREWALFAQNKEQIPEGTPVSQLFPDKPAVTATLQASNVITVEQLAELSANAIENIGMGAQEWVNKAKKYVEMSNKGVGIVKHQNDLEERDREIRVLKQQIELMKQEVNNLRANAQAGSVSMDDIQKMIAAQMQRPVMPASNNTRSDAFDSATAQINATHATREIGKRKRVKV
jgi:hypothetical protein